MKPPISAWGLRKPNSVTVLVGAPGTGKTNTAYLIADELRGSRPVYCPMTEQFRRPAAYHPMPKDFPAEGNYVVLYTDATLEFHAREFMQGTSIDFSKIMAIRRHDNVDIVVDAQNSGDLDVIMLRAVDCLVLKEPSLMQDDLERPALRKKYERANALIAGCGGWRIDNAVAFTHTRETVVTGIEQPAYWNTRISRDDQFSPVKPPSDWDRLRDLI